MDSPIEVIRARLDTSIVTRGRVVIIGLGGVGSCLIEPLSVFLASLATDKPIRVLLVDGDSFNPGNAYRVAIPDFCNKAQAWAEKLEQMFLPEQITFDSDRRYVTQENVAEIIQDGDCVFLCLDNHASRKLISNHLADSVWNGDFRPAERFILISGGNDGVNDHQDGTGGTVQVYGVTVEDDGNVSFVGGSKLDRYHPEIANPEDKNPAELSCIELAAAGQPQLVFANLAVASCMCNVLLRLMMQPQRPIYDEVCFDIKENQSTPQYLSAGRPHVQVPEG